MTEPTIPQKGNVANLVNRLSKELAKPPTGDTVALRKGGSEIRNRRAKAQYSYNPQHDDELRLQVDDIIDILDEEEDGWWRGRLGDKVGVFPSNFVKLIPSSENNNPSQIDANTDAPNQPDASLITLVDTSNTQSEAGWSGSDEALEKDPSSELVAPKKVAKVGFGNIFGGSNKIELRPTGINIVPGNTNAPDASRRTTGHDTKGADVVNEKKPGAGSTHEVGSWIKQQQQGSGKQTCKVLFQYKAQNEDELTLNVGDIVDIVSTDIEDPGWWSGSLRGRKGVFPNNFVAAIQDESKDKKPVMAVAPIVPAKPKGLASTTSVSPSQPHPPSSPGDTATTTSTSNNTTTNTVIGASSVINPGLLNRTRASLVSTGSANQSAGKSESPAAVPEKPPSSTGVSARLAAQNRFSTGSVHHHHLHQQSSAPPTSAMSMSSHSALDATAGSIHSTQDGPVPNRLSHLTASRPKNKNRRPPSQVYLSTLSTTPIDEEQPSFPESKDQPNSAASPTVRAKQHGGASNVFATMNGCSTTDSSQSSTNHHALPANSHHQQRISNNTGAAGRVASASPATSMSSPTSTTITTSSTSIPGQFQHAARLNTALASGGSVSKEEYRELKADFETFKSRTLSKLSEIEAKIERLKPMDA